MSFINKLIEKFTINPIIKNNKETFDEVIFNIKCSSLTLPTKEEFIDILNKISERDKVFIEILSDEYSVASYSEGKDIDIFLNNIKRRKRKIVSILCIL